MQQLVFKNIFESVLSSVNMTIDKLVKSVAELKASLEYSQDIDDLMEAADAIDNLEEELEGIQRYLHKQEGRLEYLENQSRRNNNIRITRISEEGNESWLNTEAKVKEALHEKLNLSSSIYLSLRSYPLSNDNLSLKCFTV